MHELSYIEAKGMELSSILNELQENFPPINPSPEDDISKIMYQAGQRSVVEWIFNQINV